MQIYLETSALLSAILEEADGPAVEVVVGQARRMWTSQLTNAESLRALCRLQLAANATPRRRLQAFQSHWHTIPVLDAVLGELGQFFPVEPVRTLDAIHLVTAVRLRETVPDLVVVSLDHRVRENARAWGMGVAP